MEFKELKSKSAGELNKLLTQNSDKLRELHFKIASKQLKNIREIRTVKKDNARLLTLLQAQKGKQA